MSDLASIIIYHGPRLVYVYRPGGCPETRKNGEEKLSLEPGDLNIIVIGCVEYSPHTYTHVYNSCIFLICGNGS